MTPDAKRKYEKMAEQAKKQQGDPQPVPFYASASAKYTTQGVPLSLLAKEKAKRMNEQEVLIHKIAKRLEDAHIIGGKIKFAISMLACNTCFFF